MSSPKKPQKRAARNRPLVPPHDHKLTKQDCFNIAWRWAQTHGPCVLPGGGCLYRSAKNDNACLIGALIPDSICRKVGLYKISPNISHLYVGDDDVMRLFADDVNEDFLTALQHCHDGYNSPCTIKEATPYPSYIRKALTEFAQTYNLSLPE